MPNAWLFEALDGLRREMTDQHQRLRTDVNAGFADQRVEVQALRADLTKMAIHLNTLQTQKEMEERQAMKRGAWAGVLAGFLISVVMKLFDFLWNPK